MPTNSFAARAGLIALSSTTASSTDALAELRNIRIRVSHDQLDAESNDSGGWRESIRGSRGWTATAESLYIPSSAATAHIFADAVINDYALGFRFMPSTSTGDSRTHNYNGVGHITDFEIGGDTKGLFLNTVNIRAWAP